MTAAKFMDIISRLPGCAGQAADAVSAYTQIENGRCSKTIESFITGMSRQMDSSSTTQMAKIMVQYGRPSRSSWKKCVWSSFGRTVLGKAICKNSSWNTLGRKFPIGNVFSYIVKKGFSYQCMRMTQKLVGKKQNLNSVWKALNKEVDMGNPRSFFDHVYLMCTQRQYEIIKDIVDNNRPMFESRISAGGVEKLPFLQNLRVSSWSYDKAGHAKKCVERYCELASKSTQQLYKVSTPCIDDHHFKKRKQNLLDNCQKCALKMFWNACTWHVLEDRYFMVSEQTCTINH